MKVYQLGITVHILYIYCGLFSEVILASIDMVLRGIPRKVSEVVGPSVYDSISESSGPTVKKLPQQ